jgi:hypothetical protein
MSEVIPWGKDILDSFSLDSSVSGPKHLRVYSVTPAQDCLRKWWVLGIGEGFGVAALERMFMLGLD